MSNAKRIPLYADKCRHFNGIGIGGRAKVCFAGVDYRALVGGPMFGWATRIPCLNEGRPGEVACPQRSLMSQEELAAYHARLEAAVTEAIRKLSGGECPTCGLAIEPSQVVGKCRYAACGHRVGQVLDEGEE